MPLNISISNLLFKAMTLMVFGAAVHICIILFLPYMAQGDAWSRLKDTVKINELALLPNAGSGKQPIAFMAPDVRYAACRFDLSNGPLQLRSPLPNELWSVALYSRHGENFYLISGKDVQARAVGLLVVLDKTIDNEKPEERNLTGAGNTSLREITVSSPSTTGIILIRAPVPNPAFFCRSDQSADPGLLPPRDVFPAGRNSTLKLACRPKVSRATAKNQVLFQR